MLLNGVLKYCKSPKTTVNLSVGRLAGWEFRVHELNTFENVFFYRDSCVVPHISAK